MTTNKDDIKKCLWMTEAMITHPASTYKEWALGNSVTDSANSIDAIMHVKFDVCYIAARSKGELENKLCRHLNDNPHIMGDRSRAQDFIDRACMPTVNVEAYSCLPSYRPERCIAVMAYECRPGDNVYAGLEDKAKRWLTIKGYKVEKAEKAEKEAAVYVELENAKKRIVDLEERIRRYNQAVQLLENVK